jgi:hypothetical protein
MGKHELIQYAAGWSPRPYEVRPEQERANERAAAAAQMRFKRRMAIALCIGIPILFVIFGIAVNDMFPKNATQQSTHNRIAHFIAHPFSKQ